MTQQILKCWSFVLGSIFVISLSLVTGPRLGLSNPAVAAHSAVSPSQKQLLEATKHYKLKNVQLFDRGIYGKYKDSTMFITSTKDIDTFDRLYWVMVQVLSTKYGCFLSKKMDRGENVYFRCRDRRLVRMRRNKSKHYMYFLTDQFTANGEPIKRGSVSQLQSDISI